MESKKTIFVSDIHLENSEDIRYKDFLHFLKSLNFERCERLVLLGDIFDLWVGKHRYFLNKFKDILIEFERISLVEKIEVHYFEGNHDLYLSEYFQKNLSFQVHAEFLEVNWQQQNIRLEHGDLSNPNDTGYLLLRSFLRNPIVRFILCHLPDFLVAYLGGKASSASRKYTDQINIDSKSVIRDYAQSLAKTEGFDILITGHTHQRDDFSFDYKKTRRSINLGSWFGKIQILTLQNEKFSFEDLEKNT